MGARTPRRLELDPSFLPVFSRTTAVSHAPHIVLVQIVSSPQSNELTKNNSPPQTTETTVVEVRLGSDLQNGSSGDSVVL